MDLTPFKNCLAHTRSMFITTNGDTKSCCYFDIDLPSKLNYQKHIELLNEVDIEKGCSHCIKIENSGTSWSHRKIFTEGNDYVISIFFDSLCNQSCVTCFPEVSSSVALEWSRSNMISDVEFKRVRTIQQYGPDKLELVKDIVTSKPNEFITIEVYGGEPTSSPQLVPMVEWLVQNNYSKNITLSLISNGSRVLKNLESHLNNFRRIKVSFSIDGVNDQFKYLRWPTTFETLQSNMDYHYELAKTHNNLFLSYNYTLSWMNSLNFFSFLDWMYNRYDNFGAYMTKLVGKDYFSVDVLSDETRQILIDKANSYKNPNTEKIIGFYNDYLSGRIASSDSSKIQLAVNHMKKLDTIRNTDCLKLFNDIINLEGVNVQ